MPTQSYIHARESQLQPYAGLTEWQKDKDSRIKWWQSARFGMFIHWGLYSPAGGYWEGKKYEQHYAEWIQHWAAVHPTEYAKKMRDEFKPVPDFAEKWASLAKRAGMRYAVLTSKHHEGFTLFNSDHPYSIDNPVTQSTNISPVGRDLVREYVDAFRNEGLKVGFYYSLLDWQHPHAYELSLPGYSPKNKNRDYKKYVEYMHHHVEELMTNYGRIDVFWPDYSSEQFQGEKWQSRELLKKLKQWQPEIVINNRLWNGLENRNGDYLTPEKYVPPTGIPDAHWEVCHTMNESFGYSRHDMKWKSEADVVRLLVDIASKGGNLLLNVGPDAKGEIPQQSVEVLEKVGDWMACYGYAIYDTKASPFSEYSFNGRCTTRYHDDGDACLYLIVFDWPKDGKLKVVGLKNEILDVYMPQKSGTPKSKRNSLPHQRDKTCLTIDIPKIEPNKIASVIAVDIKGRPDCTGNLD